MSRELTLIVDGRVDRLAGRVDRVADGLAGRIDALEAELIAANSRAFEQRKRLEALEAWMNAIAHPLIAVFTDAQAALRDS